MLNIKDFQTFVNDEFGADRVSAEELKVFNKLLKKYQEYDYEKFKADINSFLGKLKEQDKQDNDEVRNAKGQTIQEQVDEFFKTLFSK